MASGFESLLKRLNTTIERQEAALEVVKKQRSELLELIASMAVKPPGKH